MSRSDLQDLATSMFSDHKGLLAIDESTKTCDKRFATYGIPQTMEFRRAYRELIITTPGLNESIGGVILYDETIRQNKADGQSFIAQLQDLRIVPGIKVDTGAEEMQGHPGEKVTGGLDNLRERLDDYRTIGARFAKWRAVFTIADRSPSDQCIRENADSLARYALVCQEAGLVPIVEPEVLMTGNHSMEQCSEVSQKVLLAVFERLFEIGVAPEGMILKPNMVVPGLECPDQGSTALIAAETVTCLRKTTPSSVPAIAFLSGGQTGPQASERLNAINLDHPNQSPWILGFSFGRAIQLPGLSLWGGRSENLEEAQKAIDHRARCDAAARSGHYSSKFEMKLGASN